MKTKRRTEIRSEIHELKIIRLSQNQVEMFCAQCDALVSHRRVGQAALALSLSETAVFRLAEIGKIHSTETPAGALMLCSNSLATLAKELASRHGYCRFADL